jgi:hypothetical protein
MTPEEWLDALKTITVRTRAEAEARAKAEHAAHVGRVLRIPCTSVYFGHGDILRGNSRRGDNGGDILSVRVYPWARAPQCVRSLQNPWRYFWLNTRWDVAAVERPGEEHKDQAWIYARKYRIDQEMSPLAELAQVAWAPDYRGR